MRWINFIPLIAYMVGQNSSFQSSPWIYYYALAGQGYSNLIILWLLFHAKQAPNSFYTRVNEAWEASQNGLV